MVTRGFTEDLLPLVLDCSWIPEWGGADQNSIELVVLGFKKRLILPIVEITIPSVMLAR